MSDSLVPGKKVAKKTPKVEPLSAATIAFREYERVSYYLATQGNFDFSVDDTAREAFWDGEDAVIKLCIANRLDPDESEDGFKIPKGDHWDGLQARTDERVKRDVKVKKTHDAAVEALLPERMKKVKKSKSSRGLAADVKTANDSLVG